VADLAVQGSWYREVLGLTDVVEDARGPGVVSSCRCSRGGSGARIEVADLEYAFSNLAGLNAQCLVGASDTADRDRASRAGLRRPVMITVAPSLIRRRAVARPIPLVAPVTRAVLPSNCPMVVLVGGCGGAITERRWKLTAAG